jgi:hypothetical protein
VCAIDGAVDGAGGHHAPELSVVLATPYDFDSLRTVLAHLRAQTARHRMEIVVVGSTPERLAVDESLLEGFHSHRVVQLGRFESAGAARAAGIRAARAPVVVLTEEHCFPAPTWADALIDAHRGPWAAVGPAIGLANPQRYMSWANYLIQYGPWVQPLAGGEQDDVPGHNSSYKRDVLLALGADLEALFVFDTRLHEALRQRGQRLYVEPSAVSYHVFITRLLPFVKEHFHIGRAFAAARSRDWPVARRWAYAVLSAGLPLLRGTRIVRRMREAGWLGDLVPGVLPSLAVGLATSAAGEAVGYARGIGPSDLATHDLDFRRSRYVTEPERAAIWRAEPVSFRPDPPRPGAA